MQIRLEYVAMLKHNGPPNGAILHVADNTTLPELLTQLGISEQHQGVITAFVNEANVDRKYTLRDGDRVFLAMPIGGG